MAYKANLLVSLVKAVKNSAFYNLSRLEELQYKEYPYKTSQEFIDSLIEINKGILGKLENFDQVLPSSDQEFKDQLIGVQRLAQVLSDLHALLQILEMGRREYVPQGFVDLIKEIIQSYNPKAKFLLLPNHDYNYAFVEVIAPLKASLADVLPNIDAILSFADKFAIFWFPLAHKDNTDLNVLLSHEIGHFVCQERQTVSRIKNKVSIDSNKIDEIAQEWLQTELTAEKKEIKIDDYFGLETAKTQVIKRVLNKLSAQLEELIADSIAFNLFGPAYMIALCNFLTTIADIDLEPKGYPSSRTRISFLIQEFENSKYNEALKDVMESKSNLKQQAAKAFADIVETWKEIIAKEKPTPVDKESELVAQVVDSTRTSLSREAKDITGARQYTCEQFVGEALKLLDIINSLVPPAEISFETPANAISILNAGMLYELTLMENMHRMLKDENTEDRLATIHGLHKLIMKAVEASQAQRLMKS